jgi:hypothetical protein
MVVVDVDGVPEIIALPEVSSGVPVRPEYSSTPAVIQSDTDGVNTTELGSLPPATFHQL